MTQWRNSKHKSARLITGFESIAADYDGFILDQFGVMHNGVEALPGAKECYSKLMAAGKKLVILSNTSRRAGNAKGKLPAMGFDSAALSGFGRRGLQAHPAASPREDLPIFYVGTRGQRAW
jgi:ribonucleotide monophosphatase NagD (HAD superfamily)